MPNHGQKLNTTRLDFLGSRASQELFVIIIIFSLIAPDGIVINWILDLISRWVNGVKPQTSNINRVKLSVNLELNVFILDSEFVAYFHYFISANQPKISQKFWKILSLLTVVNKIH